jgi:hypothetical protein
VLPELVDVWNESKSAPSLREWNLFPLELAFELLVTAFEVVALAEHVALM